MAFYTILMQRLIIFFTHYFFLYSIYSLQVLLKVISLSDSNSVWNFGYYKIFCEMFFLPSQIYLKAIFCTTQNFLYQLRFTILPVLLVNWNKTCCIDLSFRQFCQVTEHQARPVQSFSQSFKITFSNCDREGAKPYQCFSPWGS